MKKITLVFTLLIILGCNTKCKKVNNLIQVKEILYKDDLNNYYFQYSIPERKIMNGSDVGITKYGYDSIINLNAKVVNLKTIVDYKTFKKSKGKYEDANYFYTENEFLTVPKYNAKKRKT